MKNLRILFAVIGMILFFITSSTEAKATIACLFNCTICTDQDYECNNWSQCIHGEQKSSCEIKAGATCNFIPNNIITRSCSPSVCQESSFNVQWSGCVNNKQYASFAKNEDCIDGFYPIAEKDCVSPKLCQETSFNYGEWTPYVEGLSFRAVSRNETCSGGYEPVTKREYKQSVVAPTSSEVIIPLVTAPAVDNSNEKINEVSNFIMEEKRLTTNIDRALTERLKGRILLQVENHGEAWYVNPKDGEKYYMADGEKAYQIMRNLGVGITNTNLDKIKSNKTFAKKNAGKIFLQVESRGEAYYIDFDGNAYYLKDGVAAYDIMRTLGLGITNNDLVKIKENNF